MIQISYNNKNSYDDYSFIVKSVDRPILPTLNKKEITIPGRHGTWDFEGNTYENRIISVEFKYQGTTFNNLRLKAREIAQWLSQTTYKELTFSDEPDKYYLAKIYDSIGLQNVLRTGQGNIKFECKPFALYQVTSGEDVILDSDLPLDSDILLDPVDAFTVAVTGNTTFAINYWGTQEVGLGSPDGSKFDIVITGSFTTLSITLNGKVINYTAAVASQVITIDNVNATVKNGTINKLSDCTGNLDTFLKLISGMNIATITGTGLNCSILFDFRNQYL